MKEKGGRGWTLLAIGSLAAFIFVPPLCSNPRRHNDRQVKSQMSILALAQAIEAFEIEYEKRPPSPSLDFETEGPQAAELITMLLGKENSASNRQNPRQLAFLTERISKNKKRGGLVFSAENKPEGIYDAWGNPLRVILRSPGQPTMTVSHAGKQVTTSKPAVVMSKGTDGKWGTKDDIISDTK